MPAANWKLSLAREDGRFCFIHAGTHKTGTTSLQAFLRENTEQFAAHGVLIPRSGRGIDAAGHHNLTQHLLGGDRYCPERGGLEELGAELKCAAYPRVCVSSEDFTLVSRSLETLARARDTIVSAGYAPMVVIYLRPQVPYCISIYAELVKNGYRKAFQSYLDEIHRYGTFVWNDSLGPICRYDLLLERFAKVFGANAIIVRRYRSDAPSNRMLRSFARLISTTDPDLRHFYFPPERYNPTLSFPRILRLLSHRVEVEDMRFAPLDIAQMLRLANQFWRANLSVARRFGVWVPPFDLLDLLLASPIRRSQARMRDLTLARQALTRIVPFAEPPGAQELGAARS